MPGGSGPDANQAQDTEEKFDPAAAIWEQVEKRKKQAQAKRHSEKNEQVDQVRKQVKLQETKSAKDTWNEAEAALNQVLKGKRLEEAQAQAAADPNRDDGLRKHGEHVKHRKDRAFDAGDRRVQAPPISKTSQPSGATFRSATGADERDPGATFRSTTAGSASEGEDLEAGSGSWSRSGSPCGSRGSPGSTFRSTARQWCFETRLEAVAQKARKPAERLADHGRRRLRAKVAEVLIQVRKRQDLHQLQEKAKKFREHRFAIGVGPAPSMGDHDEYALGLTCLSQSGDEQAMTSPRRTALLDSLTMEELGLIRDRPAFFFTGNAISAAMRPEQLAAEERSRSMGDTTGSFSSSTSAPPRSLWQGSVNAEAFEDLIEFFSVSSADKGLDVSVYARNLRAQLLASAGRHNALGGGGTASEVDWRKRLCRADPEENVQEVQNAVDQSVPKGPLEMMPSLGRHPPVRSDHESPTLAQVRAIYQRREEQDAEWMDRRLETINRKGTLNAFKAREQQRELMLQDFKQKELHKVRMLQAEEKKAMLDAEQLERTEVMGIQKIHRLMVANERAERLKEEKRDHAQVTLEAWHAGVVRAQEGFKKKECDKLREGERNHQKYMQRLMALGESRMVGSQNKTQGQLNDGLKTRIQDSLVAQIREQEDAKSAARAEALREKLERADARRQIHQTGNRYCFVAKAFGANSAGFDLKHHSIAVDRRKKSWQKSAEGWAKIKGSFSAPVLPPASPLSPGGTLDEAAWKTMRESGAGFKTSTSAVALA